MLSYAKIKEIWKKSLLFKLVDNIISFYYCHRLKNDSFTILCPNCVGGTVYHRFRKQFLSPTINMWMSQVDFVNFVLNLDYYLAEELTFIDSENNYPVAIIGGGGNIPLITLNFNHSKNKEEAMNDWNRRKKRINKDNLYLIMYNLDGITTEQINLLNDYPCNNKVIFTAVSLPEISWSYYIKPNLKHQFPYNYLGKNIIGMTLLERKFNLANFLNHKKHER